MMMRMIVMMILMTMMTTMPEILFIKLIIMKINFRWDCEESSQIWASCSDVKIKPKI